MTARLKSAGLIGPTVATLAGIALLLTLGQWQWQRKAWKEGLIAAQAARAKAEPVPLADALSGNAAADLEYRRVTVRGTFDHANERHLYAPLGSGSGWQVMTPLAIDTAANGITSVMVDRGFIPDDRKALDKRRDGLPAGPVALSGRIRLGAPRPSYAPDNDLARNRWFWRDLAAMVPASAGAKLPFYIEADKAGTPPGANPAEWPKPGAGDAVFNNLSNRHLEYALTWWALAATLAGVFAVFARGKLRGD
jgi:surfeit locus 1 family protein